MVEKKMFSGIITFWENAGTFFAEYQTELKRFSGSGESPYLAVRRLLSQLCAEGVIPWGGES